MVCPPESAHELILQPLDEQPVHILVFKHRHEQNKDRNLNERGVLGLQGHAAGVCVNLLSDELDSVFVLHPTFNQGECDQNRSSAGGNRAKSRPLPSAFILPPLSRGCDSAANYPACVRRRGI